MNLKKIALLISLIILAGLAYFGYTIYQIVMVPNTLFEEKETYVYIPSDAVYSDVQDVLKPYLLDMGKFDKLAFQKKYHININPGRFLLKKGMNNNDIINALRKNIPIRVTFNNQERIENLAGRIASQIESDSISLIDAFNDKEFHLEYGVNNETVLALFIPNTYEFYWNTSAVQFRNRMAKEYVKFWNEDRLKKAERIGLTPLEVSVLASIVHKETTQPDERPRVAGVYLNRLRKGMLLQADPTVIYAVKKEANDFNLEIKRVLYKDLETASPYNTYQVAGLPPGLIFMPDVNAVEAVLNPEHHNYYYFCASVTRFGYHEFATTLAQHEVNRRKYQAWVTAQGIYR